MNDRELLEAAARAAGIDVEDHKGTLALIEREGNDYWRTGEYWDPLNDDGDALRLAVRLQLTVCNEQVAAGVVYCTRGGDEVFPVVSSGTPADADVLPDDYAATRRAIVRAAAALAPTGEGDGT